MRTIQSVLHQRRKNYIDWKLTGIMEDRLLEMPENELILTYKDPKKYQRIKQKISNELGQQFDLKHKKEIIKAFYTTEEAKEYFDKDGIFGYIISQRNSNI